MITLTIFDDRGEAVEFLATGDESIEELSVWVAMLRDQNSHVSCFLTADDETPLEATLLGST